MSTSFRFQNLEVWRMAIDLGNAVIDIADVLEQKKLFRFAEQTRGVAMSISNNIAEGSGSASVRDFSRFLGFARRSTFELANILHILEMRGHIDRETRDDLWDKAEILSREITTLQRCL